MSQVLGLVNGKIYGSFIPLREFSGLVASNGRILYVGESEKAQRLTRDLNGTLIDLDGLTVMPGFIDAHMHLDGLALSLHSVDFRNVRSIRELKQRLKEFYETNKNLSWIVGRGWDQELFEESRWPHRRDLDEIVPDKPVFLERVCSHAAVVNTAAIDLVSKVIEVSKDRYFLKDEKGMPTGVVIEDALKLFREASRFSEAEMMKMLHAAVKYAASLGVTTLGFMYCGTEILSLLQSLKLNNMLSVRVRVYLKEKMLDTLVSLGIKRSFGDELLKIMGIKIFSDGSLGARTAWLSEPYEDAPETSGVPTIEQNVLVNMVEKAELAGLQLAIHAIGDKAVDMVLSAYGALRNVSTSRHRIEHASILRPDQFEKLSKIGPAVAIQPHFTVTDWWVVKRMGTRRAKWIYPFKTLMNQGVRLGISSDCPVEPLNPWNTVQASVTRGGEDSELRQHTADQSLSVIEALHLYTSGSAYLLWEDENMGTLDIGKHADFIILDKDPLTQPLDELKKITTLMTVVAGTVVHKHQNYSPT